MGLPSLPLVLRAEAQHTLMDMSASTARSHLGDAILAAWEVGCCHSWDHSLPAKEVRLLTFTLWLHGESWHDAGQTQEMEQMNSLHSPYCQDSKQHPLLSPRPPAFSRWLGDSPSPAPETHLYQGSPLVRQLARTASSQPHRHCTSVAAGAYWRGEERSFCHFSIPRVFGGFVFALSWPHQPSFVPN